MVSRNGHAGKPREVAFTDGRSAFADGFLTAVEFIETMAHGNASGKFRKMLADLRDRTEEWAPEGLPSDEFVRTVTGAK
jgi:hypothetical protein